MFHTPDIYLWGFFHFLGILICLFIMSANLNQLFNGYLHYLEYLHWFLYNNFTVDLKRDLNNPFHCPVFNLWDLYDLINIHYFLDWHFNCYNFLNRDLHYFLYYLLHDYLPFNNIFDNRLNNWGFCLYFNLYWCLNAVSPHCLHILLFNSISLNCSLHSFSSLPIDMYLNDPFNRYLNNPINKHSLNTR